MEPNKVTNVNKPVEVLPRNLRKRRDKIEKSKQEISKLRATVNALNYELKTANEAWQKANLDGRSYRPTDNVTPPRPDRLPSLKAELAYLEAELKLAPDEIEYRAALNELACRKHDAAQKHLIAVQNVLAAEFELPVEQLGQIRKMGSRRWTKAYNALMAAPGPNSTVADLRANAHRIAGLIGNCKRSIAAEQLRHEREELKAKQAKTPRDPPQQLLDMQRDIARGERFRGDPQSLLR